MRNVGLIGGLGPGATVHYYRELTKAQAGEMLIIQADMNRVLEDMQRGDRIGLAAYFARLIERLAHSGAELAAISRRFRLFHWSTFVQKQQLHGRI